MNIKTKLCGFPMVHWIHGIKTALAAGLCLAITTIYNFEYGYWAVITSVIVMQVYVADSIRMCMYRFSGTIIGAILAIAAIFIFPNTLPGRFLAVMLPVGILSFMTHYNTRYRMAAITAVIIVMTGFEVPDEVSFALFRIMEIVVGIFCAFAVSVLVFPVRLVDVLKRDLSQQAEECCASYDILIAAFLNGQEQVDEDLLSPVSHKVWKNHELFENIHRHEALIYHKKFGTNLKTIVAAMDTVLEHLKTMSRSLNVPKDSAFDIIMEKELMDLSQMSKEALMALVGNAPGHTIEDLSMVIDASETKLYKIRSSGATTRFNLHKIVQVYSFYHSMRYLAQDLMIALKKIEPQ